MQHSPQRSWRPFTLGLGSFILIVLAFLAVGHYAQAVTIENVGGTLGLGNADLKQTIVNVIKWALGLLGLVAVMVMLYGGFLWLTSRGDEKQIEKAKRTLINGAIGLVIILVSWAIVLFIQRFITGATGGSASAGQCVPGGEPGSYGPCLLCDDVAPVGDGVGVLYNDLTCIDPGSTEYYAVWGDPVHEATNVKLCQAVSAGFGGLIQTEPNPPYENDILDSGSDFAVYRCNDSGSGPNCADPVRVNGVPNFPNNVASLNPPEDYMPNSKYYVDVSQVHSVAPGNPAAVRPIPPDGWTFQTGTENDEDPPGVLQICSQHRCSNNTATRCTTDTDCGTGNFCRPLRCQTDAQCGGAETCNAMTDPANGETIQCLSPVIEVQFTEGMYPPSAMNPANMAITRIDGQPTTVGIARIDMPRSDMIQVTLNQPLVKNVTYRVTLSAENGADDTKGYRDTCSNALDCGNGLGQCTQSGMPTQGTPADDYRFDFTTADTDTVDCTPIVTAITTPSLHGNPTNQNRVIITGTNFGLAAGKQVRFSGNILATENSGSFSQCFANNNLAEQSGSPACIRTSGSNQIQTIVPTGSNQFSPTGAIDGGVVVIKGTQESPLSTATTDIQSPHISGIYPREGKAGRFVTIEGDNFGDSGTVRFRNSDGTVSVDASAPSCQPNNWSKSLIIVQVPEGFAENTQTHIQVCGKGDAACANVTNISNTSRFDYKNVDGPNLCGVRAVGSPLPYVSVFGSNDPVAPMEVLGDGFGTNLGVVDVRYSNLDGSAEAPFDEQHLVARPSGALPNGSYNFFVTVDGRASNHITYTIPKDPPPQVVQDASCNVGNAPPIMPSPNVYPESTGVCRNISLEARFTQVMDPATLTPVANMVVQRCNQNDVFSDAACTTTVNGVRLPIPAVNPTAVRFIPNVVLEDGYWYKATITSGVQSDAGVAMPVPYTWKFRVRPSGGDCDLDAVVVNPWQIGPLYTTQQGQFEAVPAKANCAILTNIPGAFSWSVIENPALVVPLGVPYTDPITATPAANKVLATVQAGSANGTAKIQASFSGKSGTGNLIVQRNYCDTDADCRGKQNDGNTYYCTGSSCNIPTHECRPWIRELQSGTQIGSNVSGPKGNLVIVRGCFFGAAKGSGNVTFTGADGIAHNGINICPANWTNDEIRIQAAPVGASPGAFDVSVIAGNTLQSSNIGTFNVVARCDTNLAGMTTSVPDGGVPILCGVTPPAGRVGNQITYNGGRFDTTTGNSEAFYTQAGGTSGALPLAGTSTSVPSANSATSHVPLDTGIPTPPPSAAQTTIGVKPVTDPSNYCIATPVDFAISCTQNSECSTGCCTGSPNGTCKATSTCYGLIASASPAAGTLTCRNSTFRVDFTELMQTSTLNSSTAYLYDTANPGVAIPARLDVLYVLPAPVGTNSIVLTPNSPLPNATYRIFVQGGKGGVTSATGRLLDANFTWPVPSSVYTVNDSSTLCKIARVEIQPASDIFTCSGDSCTDDVQPAIPLPAGPAGNQHQYTVAAYDINNRSIGLQAPWVWTQGDSGGSGNPSNVYTQGATGSICPGNATSSVYCSQSLNVPSGSEQLNVSVVGTGGSGTGTASINVQSFLCAKPWPAAGSFPFRDPVRTDLPTNQSHNFTFGFCADNLQGVSLSDPVQSPSLPGEPNLTKEYFMLVKDKDNNPTGDSIGIRIFGSTPEGYTTDLSPKRWYKQRFGKESTGTTLEVDGYPALREGRTVYVVADNYLAASGNSYPNVYVISYNDKASSETQSIFDQVLKNLKFNEIIPTPLPLPLLTNLRADLKRIHAMQELVFGLADYYQVKKANPTLDTGSYIKNMSFSAWPSWQSLGSTLGITMPQDPEVLWKPSSTLCGTGFDQGSCWNQVSKVMQFPSDSADPPESHGFAYKYVPGNPPLVPPSVQLYGTGSANIQNHDTTLISFPSPATSICPTTLPPAPVNSCLGFNFGVNASNFGQMSDWRLPSAADTTAPTPVTIDSPVNNDTVSGAVPFVITASDETGGSGMQRVDVQIKRGTTIVASTSIGAPDKDGKYRWTWSSRLALNSPPDYDVTVTAFDKAGNSQAAPNLQLTLTNPPADSEPPIITASAPSTTWNGSASIVVSATATDVHPTATNNTKVVKIEFYLGSSKLGQAPDPMCAANCPDSYTANVTIPATTIRGFPNGSYTYSVVAYDGFGNTSIKNYPVTIDKTSPDSTPPQILITLPTGTVSGANTDVVATATDASGIDRVEFLIDGIPKTVDFSGPYSFSWLLNGYAEGPHTITAVAYDRYGNQATATQTVTYMVVTGPDTQRPTITDVTATLDTNVSIPLEGAQLSNRVTLNATLTDNVAIHRAELRIDGVKIPLIGGAYYCDTPQNCILAYSWDTLPETVGQHTVSITAYDTAGYVVTVTQIVNVVNQVIMTISSPQSGTTVKDLPAGSTCSNNPTKTCTTNRDCPLVKVGSCELTGIKCYNDPICAGANPGDFCNRPLGSCNATPAGIPVVIDVTRTCSTDLTLSSVQFFLDSSPTPLPGSATCTSGRCTYTWNSKTTTSNGSHVLTAIGQATPASCRGGAKSTIVVNNDVVDTTPPVIDSFQFGAQTWGSALPRIINRAGNITVIASDPAGGSGLAQITIAINGTTVTTCNTAPIGTCQYFWSPTDGANNTVTIGVTDVAGNSAPGQSQMVNVDTTPPDTSTWQSPATSSIVTSPPDVTMQVAASDPQINGYASGIASVIFYYVDTDGLMFPPDSTGSGGVYSWVGQPPVGTAEYFAEVRDNAGNVFTTTPVVSITVVAPDTRAPWVNITIPDGDGYYVSGIFNPQASAGDWGGTGIRDVQLYLDGAPLGGPDATSPYNASSVNTAAMADLSSHSLYAVACDRATPTNLCTTSATRTFLVNNGPGSNCGPLICSGATPDCCGGPPFSCITPTSLCSI